MCLPLQLYVLGMDDDFDDSIDEGSIGEGDEDEEDAANLGEDDDDSMSAATADLLSEDGSHKDGGDDSAAEEEDISREMASYENMVLHFHGKINSRVRAMCETLDTKP